MAKTFQLAKIIPTVIIFLISIFSLKASLKALGLPNFPYELLLFFSVIFLIPLLAKPTRQNSATLIYIFSFALIALYAAASAILVGQITFYIEILFVFSCFVAGVKVHNALSVYRYNIEIALSVTLAFVIIYNRGHIFESGINYLLLSNVIIVGAITSSLKYTRPLNIIILQGLFLYASLMIQARFSFLILIIFLSSFWMKRNIWLTIPFFVSLITLFQTVHQYLPQETLTRLATQGIASSSRIELISIYFQNIERFWLTGLGIGNSSTLFENMREEYIHNFILELFSEFGISSIPVILVMCYALFVSLFSLLRNHEDPKKIGNTTNVVFIFWFLTFSKSFSLYDSYILFFYAGAILGAHHEKLLTRKWKQIPLYD